MKEPCIYIFTSPSDTVYVGQTVNFKSRCNVHKGDMNRGSSTPFHNAMRKYGLHNFDVEIIPCKEEELNLFEKFTILLFKGFTKPYNLTNGGDGRPGYIASLATRMKISNAHKGRKFSPERCEKARIAALERLKDSVYKNKLIESLSKARESITEESRKKMSESQKRRQNKLSKPTHCPKGHEYTPENLCSDGRHCKECHRLRTRAHRARIKGNANYLVT
jgi:group I intron endonuclease